MSEEELVIKYDPYISSCVQKYLIRTGVQPCNREDLKSEAVIAFLETIRKTKFEEERLPASILCRLDLAMRYRMRKYIWNLANKRNIKAKLQLHTYTFSDFDTELNLDNLDFMSQMDDYSSVDLRDALDRLTDVERDTAILLLRGYSRAEIAKLRHMSRKNVTVTVERLKTKLCDTA